jgi:hypothetical protein
MITQPALSLRLPIAKVVLPLPPGLFLATPPVVSLLVRQPASLVLIAPLAILSLLCAALFVTSLPVPLSPVVAWLLLARPPLLFTQAALLICLASLIF